MSIKNKPLLTDEKQDSMNLDQFTQNSHIEMSDDEKILAVAHRILHEHLNAFKELAK